MKKLLKRIASLFKKSPQIIEKDQSNHKNSHFDNEYDDYYDEPYDRKKMWMEHLERRYRHF